MIFFENSSNISNRATEARFCRTIFLRCSIYQKLSKLFVKKQIKKIVIFHAYWDVADPQGNVIDFSMTYFMHGSIHAIFARKFFLEKTLKNSNARRYGIYFCSKIQISKDFQKYGMLANLSCPECGSLQMRISQYWVKIQNALRNGFKFGINSN